MWTIQKHGPRWDLPAGLVGVHIGVEIDSAHPFMKGHDDDDNNNNNNNIIIIILLSHCCGLVVSDNGYHSMVWGFNP